MAITANSTEIDARRATAIQPVKSQRPANLFKMIHLLGIDTTSGQGLARTLPFTPADTTAGVENEYQTAVAGKRASVLSEKQGHNTVCLLWGSEPLQMLTGSMYLFGIPQ